MRKILFSFIFMDTEFVRYCHMVKARFLIYIFISSLGILVFFNFVAEKRFLQKSEGRQIASISGSPIDCLVHRLEKVTKRNSHKKLEVVLSLFKGHKGFESDELFEIAEEIAKRCAR